MANSTGKLQEALNRLYKRQNFGIKMGLEVEQALLKKMGDPQLAYGAIHVAGTNGKGSVCALLDSILRAAGYRVGIYTSPHLVRFNERISVNARQISDAEIVALLEGMEKLAAEVEAEHGREVTFFEYTTAMAFEYFRRQNVQLAVLETGMGGRLDATNVVIPLVSVITPVSLEHTKHLGPDIASIAGEKCGIIKRGRPVVCSGMDERAVEVVRRVARERQSTLVEAGNGVTIRVVSSDLSGQKVQVETVNASYGTLRLPLIGRHQLENLATAIAVVETLNDVAGLNISDENVKAGVSSVRWPGRFQVLSVEPPVVLDGAHNPGGGEALADTLKRFFKGRPIGLVFGMCNDKDIGNFLKPFGSLVKKCWAVPIDNERSRPATEVAAACKAMGWETVETTVSAAMEDAEKWAKTVNGAVCITGSLFLAGEVLGRRGRGQKSEVRGQMGEKKE